MILADSLSGADTKPVYYVSTCTFFLVSSQASSATGYGRLFPPRNKRVSAFTSCFRSGGQLLPRSERDANFSKPFSNSWGVFFFFWRSCYQLAVKLGDVRNDVYYGILTSFSFRWCQVSEGG